MLEHGTVIRQDPFSFTRPAAPYVGFEYGSQLLYAMAERAGGLPGVALLATPINTDIRFKPESAFGSRIVGPSVKPSPVTVRVAFCVGRLGE